MQPVRREANPVVGGTLAGVGHSKGHARSRGQGRRM